LLVLLGDELELAQMVTSAQATWVASVYWKYEASPSCTAVPLKLGRSNCSPCHCEEAFCADEAISTLQIWELLRKKRPQ
jgi:hypothetical protein